MTVRERLDTLEAQLRERVPGVVISREPYDMGLAAALPSKGYALIFRNRDFPRLPSAKKAEAMIADLVTKSGEP